MSRDRSVSSADAFERRVDLGGGQLPGIVEIGDDGAHERFVERERLGVVAEMVGKQRERQLRRAVALIGPLETGRRQAFQIEARIEWLAVYGHLRPGEAAAPDIGLHTLAPDGARVVEIVDPGAAIEDLRGTLGKAPV